MSHKLLTVYIIYKLCGQRGEFGQNTMGSTETGL